MYNWIKVFHVLSAALLFGTGLASVLIKLWVHQSKDTILIARCSKKIAYADWVFTSSAGVFQPLSGMVMIMIKGYSLGKIWVLGSILGYILSAVFWVPVAKIQVCMSNIALQVAQENGTLPPEYTRYHRLWIVFSLFAFLSLVMVFFLMTNRPETFLQLKEMIY